MDRQTPVVSIVVPLYNEEEVVRDFYKRLSGVMSGADFSYEIIFVDDCSADSTFDILKSIASNDKTVRVLSFSRNFGHQAALTAGLEASSGKCVITMDGDLQHPPELIPELIKKWKEGFEVVNTIRKYDERASIIKKATSSLFYWLLNKLTKVKIPPASADFKLYDRQVVDCLNSLRERTRFLRGLSSWVGFCHAYVHFVAGERAGGESKYTTRRMVGLALDGITSFSIVPLKAAIYLGFIVSFMSFAYICYIILVRLFTNDAVPGWASNTAATLFLGGVQLIAIGILGEYIGRIYNEVKARPAYIVSKKINCPEKDEKRYQADFL